MNSISLSELCIQVENVLHASFKNPIWIRAEISELRENNSGHCYLELIEKNSDSDAIIAKSRATIWSSTYRMLKPYFESSTGQSLQAGINVMVAVMLEFNSVYGFSLNIRDIEPSFTVGEMAARRLKIIRQLEADGIAEMNRSIELSKPVQRIAVISSDTAAGYGDFMNHLKENGAQFAFYVKLFPAIMQGNQCEPSVIEALDKIYQHIHLFDVVVIIRGGGATADLSCFDSYELALNCAQFPLPIISGIGHQRDVSVLDMVSHTSVKTPTAAAALLIEMMEDEYVRLMQVAKEIGHLARQKTDKALHVQEALKHNIRLALQKKVYVQSSILDECKSRLRASTKLCLSQAKNKLSLIEKNIEIHSPQFMLKYGYTITTHQGKRITESKNLKTGDRIKTYFHDGEVESEIQPIK